MKRVFLSLLLSVSYLVSLEPLVVGTTSGYAPYVSLDEAGHYEGFDIDFAEALAKKMNRQLVIRDGGCMPSLLLALSMKKVDLVIWAVSITKERQANLYMVYYQGEKVTRMPLLFWKSAPCDLTSFTGLKGMTLSVEAGSFQETVLQKSPEILLKQVEKVTDALMELRYGKVSAIAIDPSLVPKVQAKYPEIQVVYLPLAPEDYALGNGICIDKSRPELRDEVQKAVDVLIQEGTVAALEKKWQLGG